MSEGDDLNLNFGNNMNARRIDRAFLLLALLPIGCSPSPVGLPSAESPQIRLQVTGGLPGADYTISLDGLSGEVLGESCISSCEFEGGEVIQTLTPERVDQIQGLFLLPGYTL